MHRTIKVGDLGQNFRTVFDELVREHIPLVLTQGNQPEAVLVPYEEFLKFQEFQEKKVLERFEELQQRMSERNARFSEDEVAADVREAKSTLSA